MRVKHRQIEIVRYVGGSPNESSAGVRFGSAAHRCSEFCRVGAQGPTCLRPSSLRGSPERLERSFVANRNQRPCRLGPVTSVVEKRDKWWNAFSCFQVREADDRVFTAGSII
jgi:hypothetical protein